MAVDHVFNHEIKNFLLIDIIECLITIIIYARYYRQINTINPLILKRFFVMMYRVDDDQFPVG
jgi:hypothetical protein